MFPQKHNNLYMKYMFRGLGHYGDGSELVEELMYIIRRETEKSECLQGFQIAHALGGGTGTGTASLALLRIRDNYPDKVTSTFSVFPSPKVSDVVVEPYNAVLTIHQLIEYCDETFVIDNEALFDISHNVFKKQEPSYKDLNWIISMAMSGATASLRFPTTPKYNNVDLVPFPRLHFFLLSQAPLFAPHEGGRIKMTIPELTDQMWSSKNFMANFKSDDGKYFGSSCIYRGCHIFEKSTDKAQRREVDIDKIRKNMANDFVSWTPNNISLSIVKVPTEGIPSNGMSGTMIANTTGMKCVFQRLSSQYSKLYKRRSFLHWYTGVGMDEMEFQEADKNVTDLITEYRNESSSVLW